MTDFFKEPEPKNPHEYTGPDRVMLVVGTTAVGDGYLYCVSGLSTEFELDTMGIATAELLAGSDAPLDQPGLHVWEGKVKWSGGDEPEPSYNKKYWRKPTEEEVAAFLKGERPWPEIEGNPEYCEKRDSHTAGVECDKCRFGFLEHKE